MNIVTLFCCSPISTNTNTSQSITKGMITSGPMTVPCSRCNTKLLLLLLAVKVAYIWYPSICQELSTLWLLSNSVTEGEQLTDHLLHHRPYVDYRRYVISLWVSAQCSEALLDLHHCGHGLCHWYGSLGKRDCLMGDLGNAIIKINQLKKIDFVITTHTDRDSSRLMLVHIDFGASVFKLLFRLKGTQTMSFKLNSDTILVSNLDIVSLFTCWFFTRRSTNFSV